MVNVDVGKIKSFFYEYLTNLIHIALGFIAAYDVRFGIFIAAAYTAYEALTSKNLKEVVTDYLEFIIGIMLRWSMY